MPGVAMILLLVLEAYLILHDYDMVRLMSATSLNDFCQNTGLTVVFIGLFVVAFTDLTLNLPNLLCYGALALLFGVQRFYDFKHLEQAI